jgi:hypothetical protein
MANKPGPIYEVTLSVDPEIIEEFDVWLGKHVEEMLAIPGFAGARVYSAGSDDAGRIRRVTHYFLDSEADLDTYLAGPAEEMRQSAAEHFPGRYLANRRILHSADVVSGGLKPLETCLNCKATLSGQYCGNCGQRARSRLISIWELIRDAFGDLFELDSRVWRTLIPLVARPGKLTRDYLEGRRVRFMPPFRTYLVLSIFFFLVAFFDPRQDLGILFEADANTPAATSTTGEKSAEMRRQVLQELADEGLIDAEQFDLAGETEYPVAAADEDSTAPNDDDEGGLNITFANDDGGPDCDVEEFDETELPNWLAKRLSKKRLMAVCERIVADDGRAFGQKLLDYVPSALFILLPLMALVLKLLYPLSKRYYVEHLLFVVHFHAFFFLILILQILFAHLVSLLSLPDTIADVTVFAISLYVPVYLYKSMRLVYEQGHLATIPKYLVLMAAYFFGISFIFLFAAAFAAFSI